MTTRSEIQSLLDQMSEALLDLATAELQPRLAPVPAVATARGGSVMAHVVALVVAIVFVCAAVLAAAEYVARRLDE